LPFQIDHIRARKHGGLSSTENLALSCYNCNAHKGPNIAGHDPATGEITRLFNPRAYVWREHFAWHGVQLSGLTAIGRTTVMVLSINDQDRVDVRRELIAEGLF
jgi:hypothetical protein